MENQDVEIVIDDVVFHLHIGQEFLNERFVWNTERHCNASYELHIVLKGSCELDIESRRHVLSTGDAVIVAPKEYHKPYVITEDFERMSVSFFVEDSNMLALLNKTTPSSVVFSASPNILNLCKTILKEFSEESSFHNTAIKSLFSYLFIEILRCLSVTNVSVETESKDGMGYRTDIIDNFFQNNLDCYGAEEKLAACLYISKRQLSRVMQQHYGMSFRQMLLTSRMDRAGWLLRTSDKTIAEICRIVGYKSESTFFKNFKKQYQVAPLQYRRNYKKTKA